MLLGALFFWAVISVEILHPVVSNMDFVELGCYKCEERFDSVLSAGLTLFQTIVAGDSWGAISIPLVEPCV